MDSGVIVVLFALMLLSLSPSPPQTGTGGAVDWIQRLGWVHTETPQAQVRSLLLFASLTLLAWFAKSIFSFGRLYLSERFAQGAVRGLRQRLYEHLLRQSLAFYRARETGDLTSRVSNDIAVLQRMLSADLMEAVRAPVNLLIALGMMVSLEWRLTLLALGLGPIISLLIARSGDRMRLLMREVQRRLGKLNAFLQEKISGMETVQIFGMEQREAESFEAINRSNYRANLRVAATIATLQPLVDLVSGAGMILLLVVAAYVAIIRGPLNLATLLAFAVLSQKLASKLGLLGKIWLSGQQVAAAGDRIFEVLDTHQEVPELPGAQELPRVRGEIAFHHVSFQYRDQEPVLQEVNLTLAPGQVVALVGASGAGKTSLVRLLPRFYDPTSGWIEIDGVDLRTVTLASLRAQIGVVPQEPMLFSGTIAENIAYGRPEATREQIRAVAQAANAEEFIAALPEGYETRLGERASTLSGGQKQRIAIARALLRDPRILILDEATSALDAESEALVQSALENLMRGRTTLIIAHRLSTIQRADRILVLAGGRIVEEGTHAELIRTGGAYRRLYESQLLGAQPEVTPTP